MMAPLGKWLIVSGLAMAALGGAVLLGARFGLPRLPGDIVIRKEHFVFYAPVGWMILASLLATLLLNLFVRR